MPKDGWVTVGEYPNASCAEIASGLLSTMKLPHRIWPTLRGTLVPNGGGTYLIYVAPALAEEATRVLSESSTSDDELTAQALAVPPPDDA